MRAFPRYVMKSYGIRPPSALLSASGRTLAVPRTLLYMARTIEMFAIVLRHVECGLLRQDDPLHLGATRDVGLNAVPDVPPVYMTDADCLRSRSMECLIRASLATHPPGETT